MGHLNLVIELGSGMDGAAQGVCSGTAGGLRPASPVPAFGAMCVGISIRGSLLQTVTCVIDCTLMPIPTG